MTLFEWWKFLPGNRNKSPEQIADELKQKLKKQKPEGPLKNYPVFEYPYTREQVICDRELAKENMAYLTRVRAERIKIVSDFFQSFGFDICQLAASPNPDDLLEAIKKWGAKFWSPESNRPTNYATSKREDSLKLTRFAKPNRQEKQMSQISDQLDQFREFALSRITATGNRLTLDELFDE